METMTVLFIFCLIVSFATAYKIELQDAQAQKEKEEDIEENKKGKKE